MIAIVTVNGERGLNIQTLTKYIQPALLFEMLSEQDIQRRQCDGQLLVSSVFMFLKVLVK